MKNLLFTLVILSSLSTFGQIISTPIPVPGQPNEQPARRLPQKDDTPLEQRHRPPFNGHRFWIGAIFSPDYDYRQLTNGNYLTQPFIDEINHYEKAQFGYTAGVAFCVNFSNAVGLETGVKYSLKGWRSEVLDSTLFTGSTTAQGNLRYIDNFRYIDIPLKLNFTAGKRKVKFIASVGLVVNILINARETDIATTLSGIQSKTFVNESSLARSVDLSQFISAGIEYRLSENMGLRIQPTYQYQLIGTNSGDVLNYNIHLWSLGLNMGFYFGL